MLKINATIRLDRGKGASRRLRRCSQLPAIIYGGKEEPMAVELNHNELFNMQADSQFYSEVLTLSAEGKEIKAKVQAVQRHPFKPKILHVDFIRV